jgi:uncharacterized coiled-coil protein SlyX
LSLQHDKLSGKYFMNSLEDINLTVVRQQNEIEVMKREIVRLKDLVEDMREAQGPADSAIELPPHY